MRALVVVIEGLSDRLTTALRLEAGGQSLDIPIPPPWLIGIGNLGSAGWGPKGFDPARKVVAADETLSKAEGFGMPVELAPGSPLTWYRHIAGLDFGGGNSPGAIDFASIVFFQNFDIAYGARWIESKAGQPVTIKIKPNGFAAGSYLSVWLNGEPVFTGQLAETRSGKDFPVTLRAGSNALVFKSNNFQTQWQFAIDLAGENLDALRISATPPAAAAKPAK